MHSIDWIFASVPVLIAFIIGVYTRRYVKSVADFMSGGRMAGRYILAVASGHITPPAPAYFKATK